MKYESQFYGLSKKIENARNVCFFNQLVILTKKVDSKLSNTNICY